MMLSPVDSARNVRLFHHFFVMPTEEADGSHKHHIVAMTTGKQTIEPSLSASLSRLSEEQ